MKIEFDSEKALDYFVSMNCCADYVHVYDACREGVDSSECLACWKKHVQIAVKGAN